MSKDLTAADVARAWREVTEKQAIAVANELGIPAGLFRQGFIDALVRPDTEYAKGYALGSEARRMMHNETNKPEVGR